MSRPKPTVLLSSNIPGGKVEQILAAEAIFAVFYDGQPINIKNVMGYLDIKGSKYKKSAFSNPGHAFNLAQRLNLSYNTNRFTVNRLNDGEIIFEDSVELDD